jgi:hypothetical protein
MKVKMKCLKCGHVIEKPKTKEAARYEAQVILENEVIIKDQRIKINEIRFCGDETTDTIGICEKCGTYNMLTWWGRKNDAVLS